MPVEVEPTGQVEDLLRVLRKRVWWILVPFVLVATVGTSFAVLVPKKFVCSTRVMLREVLGERGRQLAKAGSKSAAHLIRAPIRVQAVINELWPEWNTLTRVERQDLLKRTIDNLKVKKPGGRLGAGEQIVVITFAHTEPDRALEFLVRISESWQEEELERFRRAKAQKFANLTEAKGGMEKRLEAISVEIAELNRQHGIPPRAADEGQLGPEFKDLVRYLEQEQELIDTLDEMLREVAREQKRHDKMEDLIPVTSTEQGTSYEQEIQEKLEEIAEITETLREQGYRPAHSQYGKLQDRVRALQEEIAELEDSQIADLEQVGTEENTEKLELAAEIELAQEEIARQEQKLEELQIRIVNTRAKTRELQDVYEQIQTLADERVGLNSNLTEIRLEHQRMEIELVEIESAAGNPFIVMQDPEEPTRPTEPSALLIILSGVFAGAALGLGLAVLTEYGRNCFRNVNDITRVMIVPVLGTVNAIVTRRQRRRRLVGRALIGGLTLTVVWALSYITWAWEYNQALLSDDLRNSIESFRKAFE